MPRFCGHVLYAGCSATRIGSERRNGRETVASMGRGVVALIGLGVGDTGTDMEYIAQKIINLRIFDDANGVMNLTLGEIDGACSLYRSLPSMATPGREDARRIHVRCRPPRPPANLPNLPHYADRYTRRCMKAFSERTCLCSLSTRGRSLSFWTARKYFREPPAHISVHIPVCADNPCFQDFLG